MFIWKKRAEGTGGDVYAKGCANRPERKEKFSKG